MTPSDVPKALALTNQYTSQFEIGQVFPESEEEFSHWFLSPLRDNVTTYVVEEPNSSNITDMFSVQYMSNNLVIVAALVITKSSPKQLITDLLVLMKQQNFIFVFLCQYGLKEHLFTEFSKSSKLIGMQAHWVFYNYKYPEVDNDNHCAFAHSINIML